MFSIGSFAAALLGAGCAAEPLDAGRYADSVHGSWVAAIVANHTGIPLQGVWLEEPSEDESIDLVFLDPWTTDDDTHVNGSTCTFSRPTDWTRPMNRFVTSGSII